MGANLRGHFVAENPTAEEWSCTFTVEFREKNGKAVDRAVRHSTREGEAKPCDLDPTILGYVVPLIVEGRITVRLD